MIRREPQGSHFFEIFVSKCFDICFEICYNLFWKTQLCTAWLERDGIEMKKLAVFDLDGTLLDSLGDLARCCNQALEEAGLPTHSVDAYRYFVGGGLAVLLDKAIADKDKTPENIEKVKKRDVELYNEVCKNESKAFPGTVEMLKKLRANGVITAVATNKPDTMCHFLMDSVFPGCIDISYGQREDIAKKPDPAVVYRIMQDAGVTEKKDVIYVGDSNVDIFTGLNAGVDTVGVLWGFRPEKELVDAGARLLCSTNQELYDLIMK